MPVSYVKFCPRCQTTTSVESPVCAKCGHQYRTQFEPPISEKTIAMTVAAPNSKQNGYHAPAPSRAAPPRRARLRPRRFLMLPVVLLGIAVLYMNFHFSHGLDQIEKGSSSPPQPAFIPYEVIIKNERPGQPAPIAPYDPRYLLRWQMTARPASPNNANSADDPVRVHLYLSGQIALLSSGTQARVLKDEKQWLNVQILGGRHQGLTGYINRSDASRTSATL